MLLITLCSVARFAEPLPLLKACGLLVLIAGIVLLNGGTEKTRARKAEKEATMQTLNYGHIAFLMLAVVLEIAANIFLKYSDGFRKRLPGLLSLLLVMGAFTALGRG